MADANQAAEELARAMARVQEELARMGKTSEQTTNDLADAQMKAKYGVENFTAGTKSAAQAVTSLASAGMAAGKAMLDGKKGAAAFNSSLDELSSAATAAGAALALMIPGGILIKGLIAGITMATTAYIKYTQAANEMADKLHQGYQGLAKSGAAASDGMSGVFRDAKKLGLSMNELDQMVSLIADNSKDLALFIGSVSEGRKKFADIGEAMVPARTGLMNMGMSMKDINEGTMGYLKLQTRLGNAQNMTTQQLAKGAAEYLKEQDALAKLTGQSRAEMEQQRERALQKEQFAAKIRELELSGNKKAAEELLKLNSIYEAAGPEMASAFQASVTGNLSNADAQKANLASNGEMIRSTQQVIDGQLSYTEAAQRTGKAMGQTADTVGTTLGQLGAYNNNFGPLHEQLKLAQLTQGDITKNMGKIKEDQAKQIAGADAMTAKQTQLIQTQQAANAAMEGFIKEGIGPAQDKMIALAKATGGAADMLNSMASGAKLSGKETAQDEKNWQKMDTLEKIESGTARALEKLAGLFSEGYATKAARERQATESKYLKDKGRYEEASAADIPHAADGGFLSGPTSGYLAMLHGNELVIPEDFLQGKISAGGKSAAGAGGEQADQMSKLYKEMLKDTEKLEKLTDGDLKRTQDFSHLSKKVTDLKSKLLGEEVDLLEEQNDLLEKMVEAAEKAQPGAGKDIRRSFAMLRMGGGGGGMVGGLGGMGGMGGASGTGVSMPSSGSPSMPSMGGAQGLKSPEEHQAVGSGGQGLKGTPKLGSVRSKTGKSASVNAEYAPRFQGLIDYLDNIGYEINSLGGYVDRDVRGKPGVKSVHAHGGAIDINPGANPMGSQLITDMPENISAVAKQLGLGWGGNWTSIKDAMHFSVASHEGGNIKLSEGGVAVGPNGGYPATLHGQEAVIPLNNAGGNFVKLFESMAESNTKMVSMMEEMLRAQKDSVDVQSKMLRMQN